MDQLNQSGMKDALNEQVLNKKIPVLGICVGMQMLANCSEEGVAKGLGWIDGIVKKMDITHLEESTRLPHMGWNDVSPIGQNTLFNGLEKDSKFYFLHSFYFECKNEKNSIATCNYGNNFTCAVNKENIFGVQFHPEKSHHYGIQLLKNFATI